MEDSCLIIILAGQELLLGKLDPKKLFDICDPSAVLRADQRACAADMACAPRSADPVNIILQLVGDIIIDHKINVVHINAPRRNVGCNQNGRFSSSECVHNRITLALAQIAMQAGDGEALFEKLLLQVLNPPARVAEYQGKAGLLLLDKALYGVRLLLLAGR